MAKEKRFRMVFPNEEEPVGPQILAATEMMQHLMTDIARWSWKQKEHRMTCEAIGSKDIEVVACHFAALFGMVKVMFEIVSGYLPPDATEKMVFYKDLIVEREEGVL